MLTGYNLTTLNEEYWEVYLRRHGEYNNKVNLACVFEKDGVQKTPIAGIASKMYQIEINDDLKPMNQVEISEDGDKITDSQSLYQAFIDAGGDADTVSIKLPLSRIDCSSNTPIDFSSFSKLSNLVLMGDDPTCISMMEFNEDVNLVIVNPTQRSSGRRLSTSSVKELNFIGSKMGSLLIGNYLFKNQNYKIRIEST